MAQVIEDRVCETSTSTGTGNITLSGALTGYRSFASVCAINDTMYCAIIEVDPSGSPLGQWEIGNYTYTAPNTLARTTILSSSNSNLTVNFNAGRKVVYLNLSAYQIKQFSAGGVVAPTGVWPVGPSQSLFNALTFQDEFNGTTLDTTKWHDTVWYERSQSFPINYKVEDSKLKVWPLVDPARASNGKNGFYNRLFATDGKFSQQWGFWECKAKLNRGVGCWPGIWLFNYQLTEGTLHTEIDILEAYPGTSSSLPGWSTGSPNYAPTDFGATCWNDQITQDEAGRRRLYPASPLPDLSADFHTYGMLWDRGGVTFYFDGAAMGAKIVPPAFKNANFDVRPMHWHLQLWFGSQSGTPTSALTPQGITNAVEFEYVRVWSLKTP